MRRLLISTIASLAACGLAGSTAFAQYNPYYPYPIVPRPAGYSPYGMQSSPVSPYLNLVPSRSRDYFLGTLPEFDRRANTARFSSAIYNLDQRMSAPPRADGLTPTLNETGHPAYFGNYATYYYFGQQLRPQAGGGQPATHSRPR